MSRRNSRAGKAARRAQRQEHALQPPARLQELARQSACPDCSSEVVLLHRRGGDDQDWHMEVRHDNQCPQLQFRERTGAGPSFTLIAKEGETISPEAIARSMEILGEHGLVPGRIAASFDGTVPPAPSWQERERIEQAIGRARAGHGNMLLGQLADRLPGGTVTDDPDRTLRGTVLDRWLRSVARDGVLPDCGHAVPGQPAIISTDDPQPMMRCGPCALALGDPADDRTCHLCGQVSGLFCEFTAALAGQAVATGNACPDCLDDIRRGRPA